MISSNSGAWSRPSGRSQTLNRFLSLSLIFIQLSSVATASPASFYGPSLKVLSRTEPYASEALLLPVLSVLHWGGSRKAHWLMRTAGALALSLVAGAASLVPAAPTALEKALLQHVRKLSHDIGNRSFRHPEKLRAASDYLMQTLTELGCRPKRLEFRVPYYSQTFYNVEAEIKGTRTQGPEEIVYLTAHYDSDPLVEESPGANDDASAVAVLQEVVRELVIHPPKATVRLIWFTNEENPFHLTANMGSWHYVHDQLIPEIIRRGSNIKILANISLDMVGFYRDTQGSQSYPSETTKRHPSVGDFVAIISDSHSLPLREELSRDVGRYMHVESELTHPLTNRKMGDWENFRGLPGKAGAQVQTVMLTDTGHFRKGNHYHKKTDTFDTLDYHQMARLTEALVNLPLLRGDDRLPPATLISSIDKGLVLYHIAHAVQWVFFLMEMTTGATTLVVIKRRRLAEELKKVDRRLRRRQRRSDAGGSFLHSSLSPLAEGSLAYPGAAFLAACIGLTMAIVPGVPLNLLPAALGGGLLMSLWPHRPSTPRPRSEPLKAA